MRNIILAYVPVLHEGYLRLFMLCPGDSIVLIPQALAVELDPSLAYLKKDLRAINANAMRDILAGVYHRRDVLIAEDVSYLEQLRLAEVSITMPDEDVSRIIAARFFEGVPHTFEEVFLRWDRQNVERQEVVDVGRTVTREGLVAEMMTLAEADALRASNIWRRVGAVIARDGEVLLVGHNTHLPTPGTPFAEGDPRSLFKRGIHLEMTTDHHAEARLISEAARRGIRLEGADIYLTTFPCPPCAKDVAHAGIARCYFTGGYAMLDGQRVLTDAGVELISVQEKTP